MAAPAMPGGKAIEGLRQQITANGIILFPRFVANCEHKADAFEIALSTANAGIHYQAMLTIMGGTGRRIVAEGAVKETANAALCSLLEVTAAWMETKRAEVLKEIKFGDEVRGGCVDTTIS